MTDAPLPRLVEATITADDVREHFDAVETHAEATEATVKGTPTVHARQEKYTVQEALALLLDGEVGAAQLRYFLDGEAWIDTIMRRPDGFRIVRMQQTT